MARVCIGTAQSRAYYDAISRLSRSGVPFKSLLPGELGDECELVLTTAEESDAFGDRAMILSELNHDPGIFKGQILSRLDGASKTLLVGIDPGRRTGVAVFYGEEPLAYYTFDSESKLSSKVLEFVSGVLGRKKVVRVGNGNAELSRHIASDLLERTGAVIEIVDESGTSRRTVIPKGIQGDQGAAAKIAFRKGIVFNPSGPRSL